MVYEHDWDEEIEIEKLKSLEEINFLFEYEVKSRKWVQYVPFRWLQKLVQDYFSWEVMRKWKRYKLAKMIENEEPGFYS